ncbi:MAG: Gfo/Idh/MocA family oxidoreductase [Bacteroidota bacterium]|nr:Gfo/Idh/MocA family oxidoreductase [Bacteroidota bacterium]
MKKVNKVIWGIIGAGDVCEKKSAPAMYSIPGSEVKMVMRRNASKALDFAHRHGIAHWTTDLVELLSDDDINAVYIATPPSSHAELTIKCAEAGKAIYVEKPMANSHAECQSMIKACQRADVPLFVAYYRRTLPGFLKVKELIESGKLGAIRSVTIEMVQPIQPDFIAQQGNNWRVLPEIAGGGYFHDLASHQLEYLDFLFGPIIEFKGISCNQAHIYPADDIVTAAFRFKSGVMGSGTWCFNADTASQKDVTHIVGAAGALSFNTFGSPMTIRFESSHHGPEEFCFTHSQPIERSLIQQIVDDLRGVGKAPDTATSGARTTQIMDQVIRRR